MKIKAIDLTPHFRRAYKKLERVTQKRAQERTMIFRQNCFDPRLKTHKLSNPWKECWAFSVDPKYRIIFQITKDIAIFLHIGPHSIYDEHSIQ